MQKDKKTERNSSFELLRILSVLGIIYMHSFGPMLANVKGVGLAVAVLENALFNTGVSCFVLISGYFGVKLDVTRLLRLNIVISFYSVLSTVVQFYIGDSVSAIDWILTFFPVMGKRYWFISCYFCMVILSPFLNQIPEKLKKEEFQKLLLTCLFMFSIIPTVFFMAENIMSDSGKGLANMILIYLIGRYIRLYFNNRYESKKILIALIGSIFLTFAANMFLSVLRGGRCTGVFARDCSVMIILSAVLIFSYFKELSFRSPTVNFIAKHVIAVYVFEGIVRKILNFYVDLSIYIDKWYLFVVVTGYTFLVFCICITINIIRTYTVGRFDGVLIQFGERIIIIIREECKKFASA